MTTVDPGIKCNSCGGEIFPNAGEQWDGEWVHVDFSHCYHVVSARLQTAEAELEAEREPADETNSFLDSLIAALNYPIVGDEVFLPEIVEFVTALRARTEAAEADLAWEKSELADAHEAVDAVVVRERAALARAEAAEAEARQTSRTIGELLADIVRKDETLTRAAARVAELEAALAAHQTATEYRPMGGDPPPAGELIEIRRTACMFPPNHDGDAWQVGRPEGWFICWWNAGNGWEWRSLSPLTQEEPTP